MRYFKHNDQLENLFLKTALFYHFIWPNYVSYTYTFLFFKCVPCRRNLCGRDSQKEAVSNWDQYTHMVAGLHVWDRKKHKQNVLSRFNFMEKHTQQSQCAFDPWNEQKRFWMRLISKPRTTTIFIWCENQNLRENVGIDEKRKRRKLVEIKLDSQVL